MIKLYEEQLRLALKGYKPTYSDIAELSGALIRIEVKSKNNKFKEINLKVAKERLEELLNATKT